MLINSNLEFLSERIAVISNDHGEERFDAVHIGAISVISAFLRCQSRGDSGCRLVSGPHPKSSGRWVFYRRPCVIMANAIEACHMRDGHDRAGRRQLMGQARVVLGARGDDVTLGAPSIA